MKKLRLWRFLQGVRLDEVRQGHFHRDDLVLERFNLADLDGQSRGLVVLARMHALWWLAQSGRVVELLEEAS
ncbi:MAG: hypothetical protein M1314_03795, partial [Firmicutes bacterium]|nr:hypothetical protein [Bacillota bacterium]